MPRGSAHGRARGDHAPSHSELPQAWSQGAGKVFSSPCPQFPPNFLGFHHPHPTVTGDSAGDRSGLALPLLEADLGGGGQVRPVHVFLQSVEACGACSVNRSITRPRGQEL